MPENNDLLDAAVAAATRAADFVRRADRPEDPADWGQKGTSDFVTKIDREAEVLIAQHLLARFPDSTVLGEELSPDAAGSDLVWIVDPLDGTTNYLHAYPAYAVSIAALQYGELSVGVVVDITKDLVYRAAAGQGAWRHDEQLHVSPTREPEASLIGTGFPFKALDMLPSYLDQFATILRSTSGIRRAGAAALDLVDVASGRFEGFWELQLAPWDIAAGALLVREAGGVITDIGGSHNVAKHGSIVAGNPDIHAWLMRTLGSP